MADKQSGSDNKPSDDDDQHRGTHIAAVITAFLATVAAIFAALLFMDGDKNNLFTHKLRVLRDRYQTDVFQSGPMCPVAMVTYAFQAMWTIYNITLIWRRSKSGFLYLSPYHIPFLTNVTYAAAIVLKVFWFFLWDKEKVIVVFVVMAVAAVCASVALVVALWQLDQKGNELLDQGLRVDVIVTRLLVHNGLCMLVSWMWLQMIIRISMVAYYEGNMSQRDASSLSLGIMAVFLITAVLLDFYYDKYTRYVFALYPVTIASLACILAANWDPEERNSIITLVIVLTMGFLFIAKIVYVIRKAQENPEPLLLNKVKEEAKVEKEEEVDGVINLPPPEKKIPSRCRIITTTAVPYVMQDPVEVLNILQPAPAQPNMMFQPQESHIFQAAPAPSVMCQPQEPYIFQPAPAQTMMFQPQEPNITISPVILQHDPIFTASPAIHLQSHQPDPRVVYETLNIPTITPEQVLGSRGSLRGAPMGVLHLPRGHTTHHTSHAIPSYNIESRPGNYTIRSSNTGHHSIRGLHSDRQSGGYATNSDYGGYPLDTRSNLI